MPISSSAFDLIMCTINQVSLIGKILHPMKIRQARGNRKIKGNRDREGERGERGEIVERGDSQDEQRRTIHPVI